MTDDFSAISGEHGVYVPCDEVALAPTPSEQDTSALYGDDEGFVAAGSSGSAESGDGTDVSAMFGQGRGFVHGPCECTSPTVLDTYVWNQLDVGSSGTVWDGSRTDRAGSGSFTHQIGGAPFTTSQWITFLPGTIAHTETERRGYGSLFVGFPAGATHYRLTATLRNYIYVTELSYVEGNPALVDWELVAGAWGTGTPTWDAGTTIATGTIPASTPYFDDDGIVVVPVSDIQISVVWPATPPYAQWYFRDVSVFGYRHPQTFAPPFTPGQVDLRYPNDTLNDANLIELRSFVAPAVLTSAADEDWTLEVLHC